MSTTFRSALCLLFLGIISFAVFFCVRNARGPIPPPPGDPIISRTDSGHRPNSEAIAAPPVDANLNISETPGQGHPVPRPSHDWSDAFVLKEKSDRASANDEDTLVRHRIVAVRGFSQPVHLAQAVEANPNGSRETTALISARIANQVLLSSADAIDPHEVADIAKSLGWRIASVARSPYFAVLESPEADFDTVDHALKAIADSGTSLSASPNQIYYTLATPNDPRFTSQSQWGLTQTTDVDIDAPEGWDIRSSASSIVVAVVDTGIRFTHEDLKSNLWKNSRELTRNGRDDDGNGYIDDTNGIDTVNTDTVPNDDNGHGTHAAGIVGAAGNNGKGIAGVAWNVQLMAIKSLNADGRGTTSSVVEGIDYAVDHGAHIINASWGADSYDHAIEQAIERARSRGILFVAAAGNESRPYPSYPASSTSDNVISVGSVDHFGNLSSFSNYGSADIDLLAPGNDIVSTWHNADDAYTKQSGTSMAAPFVSGILALNLVQHSGNDYSYQAQRLIASSQDRGNLRNYARAGGIVNLANSLRMTRIPVPPRITTSWVSDSTADEGTQVSFYVGAESEMELSYKWYHNDVLLGETSASLLLENVQPYQRGLYVVEVTNADATVSASFDLEVFPRMWQMEALMGADVRIFASHEDHWELIEEDGSTVIANRQLATGESADLRFVSDFGGMLQFFGKKPKGTSDNTTTSLNGPNSLGDIAGSTWSLWETRHDYDHEFEATIRHQSRYHYQTTSARTLLLQVPKFYTRDKLPPRISHHPRSVTVRIGELVHLFVSAFGENLQYQWHKDGTPIEGANGNTLQFTVASTDDTGNYYATVSNAVASATSSYSLVQVDTSPQPASVTLEGNGSISVDSGEPLTLSMRVSGAQPIKYQWYRNERPIPGATGPHLQLGPASIAHAGSYRLSVENDLNVYPDYSQYLQVYVTEQRFPPRFSLSDKEEKHLRLPEGFPLFMSLRSPSGSLPLEFQWFKDGEPLTSHTTYLIIDPVAAADAGTYYLEAINQVGVDQSGRITLEVTPPLKEAIDYDSLPIEKPWSEPNRTDPVYQTAETWDGIDAIELRADAALGESSLSLRNDDRFRVITFRWKIEPGTNGVLHVDGTEDFQLAEQGSWKETALALAPFDYATFRLSVNEGSGRAWLDGFHEDASPYLLRDLAYSLPRIGEKVTLSAEFAGNDTTYQWHKNNVPISGANSTTLTIDAFSATDIGAYRLDASNAHGSRSTSSANVGPDSIDAFFPSPLTPVFSDPSKVVISRDQSGAFLGLDLSELESFTVDVGIAGPQTLTLTYDLRNAQTTLHVDGMEQHIENVWGKADAQIFIPKGTHATRLTVAPWSQRYLGKLYAFSTSVSPYALVRENYNSELGEYGAPLAEYAGSEPLTVNWYRNDEIVSTQRNTKSGQSLLFTRKPVGHDHGTYRIEVTDAHGNTTKSKPLLINLNNDLRHVIEFDDWIYFNPDSIHVDRKTRVEGEASLRFEHPFKNASRSSNYSVVRY